MERTPLRRSDAADTCAARHRADEDQPAAAAGGHLLVSGVLGVDWLMARCVIRLADASTSSSTCRIVAAASRPTPSAPSSAPAPARARAR